MSKRPIRKNYTAKILSKLQNSYSGNSSLKEIGNVKIVNTHARSE
jgi:hypothetical protein